MQCTVLQEIRKRCNGPFILGDAAFKCGVKKGVYKTFCKHLSVQKSWKLPGSERYHGSIWRIVVGYCRVVILYKRCTSKVMKD